MFRLFAIVFLTVPLLEIFLLLQVGEAIGAIWTVFLVVLTAVIGVGLLRMQGISTIHRLQECNAWGEPLVILMIEGMMLLFAGALLLTLGFFTDAVGFAILFPPIRQYLAIQLLTRGVLMGAGAVHHRQSSQNSSSDKNTYDGDFRKIDDK